MLDPALLRKDLDAVVRRLASRGFAFSLESFNALESRRKAVQTETENLQAQRNALAKQIGGLKSRGEDASAVMAQSQAIPLRLKTLEQELAEIQEVSCFSLKSGDSSKSDAPSDCTVWKRPKIDLARVR